MTTFRPPPESFHNYSELLRHQKTDDKVSKRVKFEVACWAQWSYSKVRTAKLQPESFRCLDRLSKDFSNIIKWILLVNHSTIKTYNQNGHGLSNIIDFVQFVKRNILGEKQELRGALFWGFLFVVVSGDLIIYFQIWNSLFFSFKNKLEKNVALKTKTNLQKDFAECISPSSCLRWSNSRFSFKVFIGSLIATIFNYI